MKILVTAGNTLVPIDRVRAITNVFSGRTGAGIARHAAERGHDVTLLTSHPEAVGKAPADAGWRCLVYRTFDDLHQLMSEHVSSGGYDAVIHCAAVSDYQSAGVMAPAAGTRFDSETLQWTSSAGGRPTMIDRLRAKVKSDAPELWLRLVRTPKLVDLIRRDWGFRGMLVKFKLEVALAVDELLDLAEASRLHSQADWMVANILNVELSAAYLGPFATGYEVIPRADLPRRLLDVLENPPPGRPHG